MEKTSRDSSGLPCFVVCERPNGKDRPDALAFDDDLFMDGGHVRYPMIGILNINSPQLSFTNRVARLSIALDKAHQDRGYGTELLTGACDYMFNVLSLHRCELNVKADNARAIRCYEKVGFLMKGRHREVYFDNGMWKDDLSMAMLERDWREENPKAIS